MLTGKYFVLEYWSDLRYQSLVAWYSPLTGICFNGWQYVLGLCSFSHATEQLPRGSEAVLHWGLVLVTSGIAADHGMCLAEDNVLSHPAQSLWDGVGWHVGCQRAQLCTCRCIKVHAR